MRIGTIRWDAYYETNDPKSPASQVARALSPREYHHVAPFFSKVTADGNIVFDDFTMEIWEKEADYAINAGIDYFAYVWYRDDDPLSTARKYHVESKKHDQIQMCGIVDSIRLGEITMQQLYAAMQEEFYLKTGSGSPILYIYNGAGTMDEEKIVNLRREAKAAGVEKPLYVAAMLHRADFQGCEQNADAGYDALSFYSTGATSAAMPYVQLAQSAEARNITTAQHCKALNLKIIPSFTAGRATRPRLDHPVSWAGDYAGWYAQWGTPREIAQHAANVIKWAKDNIDIIDADAVISYAWNEHDEGGWLCPTIGVDENGDPLYTENGKPEVDTSILDALKKVLKQK